jgi:[ribosomal protein S5]-alanine N-acetyltransferase
VNRFLRGRDAFADLRVTSPICPPLHGERTALVPLVEAHAAVLFPLLADADVWRYTDDDPLRDVDALARRYRRLESRRSPDGTQLWLNWAVEAAPHGVVGFVQATVSPHRAEADVAYVIGREFQCCGFGTDAVRAMLAFLAARLAVTRAEATVDARNGASLQLLAKIGFRVVDDTDPRNVRLEMALGPGRVPR